MRQKHRIKIDQADRLLHTPKEQSGPVQFWSQVQVLVSALWVPWPEHWSGHMAFAISQLAPPQPGWQWHSPWMHTPWAEQLGSMQSTGEREMKRDINRCVIRLEIKHFHNIIQANYELLISFFFKPLLVKISDKMRMWQKDKENTDNTNNIHKNRQQQNRYLLHQQ